MYREGGAREASAPYMCYLYLINEYDILNIWKNM